jgi:PAT family beta-lactamase induction signal transducer AmpG
LFGFLQAIAIIGFAILAQTGADLWVLTWVIGFEALSVGLGTAAFTSYIALETNPRFTATQFALFTSLSAVPRTFINALTGYIVELTGWTNFFVICFILAIPGLLLLPKIAPWNKEKQSDFEKAA